MIQGPANPFTWHLPFCPLLLSYDEQAVSSLTHTNAGRESIQNMRQIRQFAHVLP